MHNFKLGSLTEWESIGIGELVDLQLPKRGVLSVQCEYMASTEINVYVVSGDKSWLVGHGSGLIRISFCVSEASALVVEGPAEAAVFLCMGREVQVIPEDDTPSFTTIAPRGSEASQEIKRMMHMVHLNSQRRERALAVQLAELEARLKVEPSASTESLIETARAEAKPAEPPAD